MGKLSARVSGGARRETRDSLVIKFKQAEKDASAADKPLVAAAAAVAANVGAMLRERLEKRLHDVHAVVDIADEGTEEELKRDVMTQLRIQLGVPATSVICELVGEMHKIVPRIVADNAPLAAIGATEVRAESNLHEYDGDHRAASLLVVAIDAVIDATLSRFTSAIMRGSYRNDIVRAATSALMLAAHTAGAVDDHFDSAAGMYPNAARRKNGTNPLFVKTLRRRAGFTVSTGFSTYEARARGENGLVFSHRDPDTFPLKGEFVFDAGAAYGESELGKEEVRVRYNLCLEDDTYVMDIDIGGHTEWVKLEGFEGGDGLVGGDGELENHEELVHESEQLLFFSPSPDILCCIMQCVESSGVMLFCRCADGKYRLYDTHECEKFHDVAGVLCLSRFIAVVDTDWDKKPTPRLCLLDTRHGFVWEAKGRDGDGWTVSTDGPYVCVREKSHSGQLRGVVIDNTDPTELSLGKVIENDIDAVWRKYPEHEWWTAPQPL